MRSFLIVMVGLLSFTTLAEEVKFPPQQNCVAWRAKKVMFLVSTQWPVGMNCQVELNQASDAEGRRFVLVAPLASFDSGEKDRDKVVMEMLGAPEQRELVVDAAAISSEKFTQILSGQIKKWPVELILASVRYDVEVEIDQVLTQNNKHTLTGHYTGTLSEFAIKLPSVAGGLVASPKDYIELHFQVSLP